MLPSKRAAAVIGYIGVAPGNTFVNGVISRNHPSRAEIVMKRTRALASLPAVRQGALERSGLVSGRDVCPPSLAQPAPDAGPSRPCFLPLHTRVASEAKTTQHSQQFVRMKRLGEQFEIVALISRHLNHLSSGGLPRQEQNLRGRTGRE